MPRYLVRRRGKTIDYTHVPKGMPKSKLQEARRKHFRGYRMVSAPNYRSAIAKTFPKGTKVSPPKC